jgi:hypothetical protein
VGALERVRMGGVHGHTLSGDRAAGLCRHR